MNQINNNPFNILTFDGGGVKGALSSTLLRRLTDDIPDLLDKTNLLGGTSTGSFIAAGLAYGIPIKKIEKLYSYENSKYIFSPKFAGYFRPKYNNRHLAEKIDEIFPFTLKLKDLDKYVVIPAFSLGSPGESWRPVFFNNLPGSDTADTPVRRALLASSAAPVYFPEYNHKIDGGVVANDPGLACAIQALSTLGAEYGNTNLCTIGTGTSENRILESTADWGALEWMTESPRSSPCVKNPILDITIEGNALVSSALSKQLLGDRYKKIDPILGKCIELDNYEDVPYLKVLGESYDLNPYIEWFNNYWK